MAPSLSRIDDGPLAPWLEKSVWGIGPDHYRHLPEDLSELDKIMKGQKNA